MLDTVTRPGGYTLTDVERRVFDELLATGAGGPDQLRLTRVPFVPEVQLHLAEDAIVLWARLEAAVGQSLPPPFWASAWAGGQGLARYVLDHPEVVAGRRALDLAAGSGLVAVAAAKAGAAVATANDIDPYALAAIRLNARANAVQVDVWAGDLLDGDAGGAEVVLAGDVFYSRDMSRRMLAFLDRVAARGGTVLVGDPGRAYLPKDRLDVVATYRVPVLGALEDAEVKQTDVLRLRSR
ncbi:MAG: methyltransferase [Micromonosporaceae bacterium]|jgi:predicted nicotinamide N-methyase|nr:methyltransferase [Micromonosporaceae bacterium]